MEELKQQKNKKNKVVRTLSVDESLYNEFRDEMNSLGYSMSAVLSRFMKKVLDILKSGGGEVVFGIEGENWTKPTSEEKIRHYENQIEKLKKEEEAKNKS